MGKFFFTILAGFAAMEREMIIERTKLGLDRARANGKLNPRGKDKGRRRTAGYNLYWQKQREKVLV
jgi:DNA invertase Pin-like site-specific DNA recombinase